MNNKDDNCDTSVLSDAIFTLKGEEFFRVIRPLIGEVACNILEIQMIDSAENFLNTNDIFDIFNYDSDDIDAIKSKSCFKMKDGQYIVRTGVLNNMTYLKTVLKKKFEEQHIFLNNLQKEKIYELINRNPILQSLIAWYSRNEFANNDINKNHSFMSSFIDTITKNIVKQKQNYRYDDSMKDFAVVLYTLGGKQVYEFVRINIIGALPNLTTLKKLISSTNAILTEGRFCFDALQQYLNSVKTNSFVGFVTKLSNGVPIPDYYQTDSFEELQFWFNNIEKSNLLNIHMFQPIPQLNRANAPASFLMSAYGVDSTSTAIEILHRWIYIFNNCSKSQIRIIGFSTGLELAWCVVFVCRLWWAWLQNTNNVNISTENKNKNFITRTAYWSVEINAHMLLYLILLVKENQLPKEALHIYLFNSQSCESMFRNTRSLSGAFSTIVNFTVADFLGRSKKLSILNKIKCQQQDNEYDKRLFFPTHHKHKNDNSLVAQEKLDDVYSLDVEQIVFNSYKMALNLIEPLNIISVLKEYHLLNLNSLSKYTFNYLNTRSTIKAKTSSNSELAIDYYEDDEDEEDDDDYLDNNEIISNSDEDSESLNESFDDDEENLEIMKNDFNGINIRDKINMEQENCYFKIKINGVVKYMHKQTACWILTEENGKVSTDRLSRVMQMNKK
ncbi:unnamed protein product [Rotaria sordida]|uniref:THAP9-like helix-turn-helix domain-containing protein n=1 Tax=Rotaria sordida TaxID=392033 RepID=A0A815UZJ9_9BILA|nr:unnamed protein product [Rotaria sordida]CAF1527721.1 unnamed protein product [Rotaria sordida]